MGALRAGSLRDRRPDLDFPVNGVGNQRRDPDGSLDDRLLFIALSSGTRKSSVCVRAVARMDVAGIATRMLTLWSLAEIRVRHRAAGDLGHFLG